jgi:hypothetical protein
MPKRIRYEGQWNQTLMIYHGSNVNLMDSVWKLDVSCALYSLLTILIQSSPSIAFILTIGLPTLYMRRIAKLFMVRDICFYSI